MRYKDRICTNEEKINQLLHTGDTGFLGLANNQEPYIIPLNYIWHEDSIYFHGANEGKKMEFIHHNPQATFVIMQNEGTMVSPIPAHTDTAFMSIMLFGTIEIVNDLEEATTVMQALLDKYVPGYYNTRLSSNHVERYRSSLGGKTIVCKLKPTKITAKENSLDSNKAFYPGRKVTDKANENE